MKDVKVLVVRQPWAWLIVHGFKDIENRSWKTRYRGKLLIQASANLPSKDHLEEDRRWVKKRGVKLPEELETGGIVGKVELVDCVDRSRSKWFEGPIGWVLTKPKRLPFMPLKGRLGLFNPPLKIIRQLARPRSTRKRETTRDERR